MGSSDKLPLVEVFFGSPWEAELVRGLLESVGIQAALKNYNMGYMAITMLTEVPTGGGVAVLVSADDYDTATEIIANRENIE